MSALTIPPLLQILSIPELATLIFRLLFSAGPHQVYFPPTWASRSAQLLRVSKLTHALAAPALYAMTEFVCLYDCIVVPERDFAYLPARQYRQWIRCLKMEDPGIPALRLGEYSGLRRLTVVVPWLFWRGQAEAEAMIGLQQSRLMKRLLNLVGGRAALQIVIEGQVYEVGTERYHTVSKRMVVNKSGEVRFVDAPGASLSGM